MKRSRTVRNIGQSGTLDSQEYWAVRNIGQFGTLDSQEHWTVRNVYAVHDDRSETFTISRSRFKNERSTVKQMINAIDGRHFFMTATVTVFGYSFLAVHDRYL
jgi:hypothetical protein